MAKTRDLAKATLDQLRRYLENPDNAKGKTGPELADEILWRYFRKFRKPGRQHKWRTTGEFGRFLADIVAVCDDVFVVHEGEFKIREGAKRLPPAEKIAYRLRVKFPSNPKYRIAPTTLTKQIKKALEFNQPLELTFDAPTSSGEIFKVIDKLISRGKR
jgi:hypothetical protein